MSKSGTVYKLCCVDTDITEEYVGSTKNFNRRKTNHKTNCNNEKSNKYNMYFYQFIRDTGGFSNWSMIQLEVVNYETKRDLEAHERRWIEQLKPKLNKNIPGRTVKEYYENNKDKFKEHNKEYYENNKDTIKEYLKNNKDTIKQYQKEYYKDNKDKKKEYYEDNKDTIKDKIKQYQKDNKDKITQYKKQYQKDNKDKIKEQKKEYNKDNKDKMKQYQKEYYKKKKDNAV